MNEQQLHEKLRAAGIAGVGELESGALDPYVHMEPEALVEAFTFLRDDPDCAMEVLHNLTAVEREKSLDVVYHLCSYAKHHSLTFRVTMAKPEGGADQAWHPEVPSVASVYRAADWHEREQWDLLGVRFTGHPDLRRILLPQEWIGHPLRKDYVYPSSHGGIPLELDAVPIYERDDSSPEEPATSRPAGTPLVQPPTERSERPHAGGRAPDKAEKSDKASKSTKSAKPTKPTKKEGE